MTCPKCGHDCAGLEGHYCPICGTDLYPNFFAQPPKKKPLIKVFPIVMICAVVLIAVIYGLRGKSSSSSASDVSARSASSAQTATQTKPAVSSQLTYDVVESGVFHDDNNYYSTVRAYFAIKNTSSYPVYFECDSIDYEDADGHLLAIDNLPDVFPPVIGPGERGYMFSSRMLDDPLDPDAEISFKDHDSLRKATVQNVRLQVTEINVSQNGKKVLGRVWNNTKEKQSLVSISGVVFNNRKCIGYFDTSIVSEIPVDGKASFETYVHFLSDEYSSQEITSYEVYAYPMTIQW